MEVRPELCGGFHLYRHVTIGVKEKGHEVTTVQSGNIPHSLFGVSDCNGKSIQTYTHNKLKQVNHGVTLHRSLFVAWGQRRYPANCEETAP